MMEQTQPKPNKAALRRLERAAMISTVLIWLGVLLAGIGLYRAYRNHQQQAAAWAQATAIASTSATGMVGAQRVLVATPTATFTPTPEVFPLGWQTATPSPKPIDISGATGGSTPKAPPVLSTRPARQQPTPTSTPQASPQPPDRLVIPKIELDAAIIPIGWHSVTDSDGQQSIVWQVADNAVGWHKTSALVGQAGNLVLNAHHNIKGQVFRYLVELDAGDRAIVYADGQASYYTVTEKHILKEKDEPIEVRRQNAEWIGPTDDQRLTMVTCWPYTDNTHRLVIVARPATAAEIEELTPE